jgi:hypothetical protein
MVAIFSSLLVLTMLFLCRKRTRFMPAPVRIALVICAVVAYTIIIIRLTE